MRLRGRKWTSELVSRRPREPPVVLDSLPAPAEAEPIRLKWTPELANRFCEGFSHTRPVELSFSKLAGRSLAIAIDHYLGPAESRCANAGLPCEAAPERAGPDRQSEQSAVHRLQAEIAHPNDTEISEWHINA
jgi:hypothetical protein